VSSNNYVWANGVLEAEYPTWNGIDSILATAIRKYFPDDGMVLDVGCGKNSPLTDHRNRARLIVGTDIDLEEIRENAISRALVVSDGSAMPFAPESFDLVFSKTAIEHMREPVEFFRGVHRALKPGGVFVWATSNLRSLPMIVSRLTPLGVHRFVYRRLFADQLQIEQFPTYYRANTEASLEAQLNKAGFKRLAFHRASWPQYFAVSRLLFKAMLPVHRWCDRVGLELLQVHLIGIYQKIS
jgi:SAM-dependent methyltransferase